MKLLLVFVGGGLGSAARYLVGVWTADLVGASFPWGTLTVNIAGCFIIGVIATLADETSKIGPQPRLFLVIGVLGGFTTFSSFSLDAYRLLEKSEPLRAAIYVLASLAVSFAAVSAGIAATRAVAT